MYFSEFYSKFAGLAINLRTRGLLVSWLHELLFDQLRWS